MTDELPPGVEAALRRFDNSLSELRTETARLRDLDCTPQELSAIDEEYLFRMADMGTASIELKNCAEGIRNSDFTWSDVVEGRLVRPPEIVQLIAMNVEFSFTTQTLDGHLDDEDRLGPPKSWLED